MHIGILTGGGDVPGLNPCIKAVVNRASDSGHTVTGIRRGWAGLLTYNPAAERELWRNAIPLDNHSVRTVDRSGGTFLHTSRTNPSNVKPAAVPEFLRDSDWSDNGKAMDLQNRMDVYVFANAFDTDQIFGDSQVADGAYVRLFDGVVFNQAQGQTLRPDRFDPVFVGADEEIRAVAGGEEPAHMLIRVQFQKGKRHEFSVLEILV